MLKTFKLIVAIFLSTIICNATDATDSSYLGDCGLPSEAGRSAMASEMSELETSWGLSLGLDIQKIAKSQYGPSRFSFPLSCLLKKPDDLKPFLQKHGFQFDHLNDGVTKGWLRHAEDFMRETTDGNNPYYYAGYGRVFSDKELFVGELADTSKYVSALRNWNSKQSEEYLGRCQLNTDDGVFCCEWLVNKIKTGSVESVKALVLARRYAQMWDDVLRCESAERTGDIQVFLQSQRKITSEILDGFRVLDVLMEDHREDGRTKKRSFCSRMLIVPIAIGAAALLYQLSAQH